MLDHDFIIIGLSETHLKGKPHDFYNLPNYNMEYTNRIGCEKGGVCLYISNRIRYKLRKDLFIANTNYECCFIEVKNCNSRNAIVGVIYRAHTSIDDFIHDIDAIYNKKASENKLISWVISI